MNLRIPKGCYGYIKRKRIFEIVKTAVYFAISLSLYFAGIAALGSNQNLLTLVAVLGCLPASKSAVGMIMYLRYQGCPEAVHENVNDSYENLYTLYDMVFTSYEHNFEVHHMGINDKVICAYSEQKKLDTAACERHLSNMLIQNGIKNVTVKVFQDLSKYKNRLKQLGELNDLGKTAQAIRELMMDISL